MLGNCIDCGKSIEKSPPRLRCYECAKKKNLERAKLRQKNTRKPKNKHRMDICEKCGREFEYYLSGRVRKYCDECKKQAYKEVDGRTSLNDEKSVKIRRALYHLGHVVFMINHRNRTKNNK